MGDTRENIGMMSGAYFVGRVELLRWMNELTGLNYTKIEQTASGVVACHIFDALYPGLVRLEKVKFNARQSHDFVHNYKVLQAAFTRANLKKDIQVEKLIKGKYQDNLEFMQWIKAFYESHASEDARTYDGRARREAIQNKKPGSYRPLAQNRAANRSPLPKARSPVTRSPRVAGIKSRTAGIPPKNTKPMVPKELHDKLVAKNEALEREAEDSRTERDFYYEKLRVVESIVQNIEDHLDQDQEVSHEFYLEAFDEIKHAMYSDETGEVAPEEEQPADENVDALQEHLDDADLLADEEGYIDHEQ